MDDFLDFSTVYIDELWCFIVDSVFPIFMLVLENVFR